MPYIKLLNKKCAGCGKEYTTKIPFQKYCSYQCAWEYRKPPKTRTGKYVKCRYCSKEIYVRPSSIGTKKYCSYKCRNNAISQKENRICSNCGKTFIVKPSAKKHNRARYCSQRCFQTSRKAQKTRTIDVVWARVVKLRANKQCEYCGKQSSLNSHHIFSRSNYSVRWDVENGVCLCPYHHLLGIMSAHKAPIEFAEWLKEKRGAKWYEELRKKAQQISKADRSVISKQLKTEEHFLHTGRQVGYGYDEMAKIPQKV